MQERRRFPAAAAAADAFLFAPDAQCAICPSRRLFRSIVYVPGLLCAHESPRYARGFMLVDEDRCGFL